MKSKLLICCFLLLIIILPRCSSNKNPIEPIDESITQLISAAKGGTITSNKGISLQIPPGALEQDTEIKMIPFNGKEIHEWCVSAVHLEPDGLMLKNPATLSFPLHANWSQHHQPLIFVSFSENPAEYFDTGMCAEITGLAGQFFAQTQISHFSDYGPVYNCHKGTLTYLLNKFEARGCDGATTWKHVQDSFPDVNTNITANPQTGTETLQAFLDTYFEDFGGYNENESVESKWREILNNIKNQNKEVVVLFKAKDWGSADERGFYDGIAHSTTLELRNGKLKLRNSVSASDDIVNALINKNGENVLWYPGEDRDITAQDLDNFRKLRSFEALENELSNRPDLFAKIPKDKSKRPQPWTAVRFYVSNFSGDENPCANFPEAPILNRDYLCWVGIDVLGYGYKIFPSNPYANDSTYFSVAFGCHDAVGKISKSATASGWEFSDDWDSYNGEYDYSKGTLVMTFNNSMTKVLTLDLKGEFAYPEAYGDPTPEIFKFELNCSDIPLKSCAEIFEPYCSYLKGQQIRQKINSLKFYREDVGWWNFTLSSFQCNESSFISIIFF